MSENTTPENLMTTSSPPLTIPERAALLRQRIQSGETIPLPEISAFLAEARKAITTERRKVDVKIPPKDVDFF